MLRVTGHARMVNFSPESKIKLDFEGCCGLPGCECAGCAGFTTLSSFPSTITKPEVPRLRQEVDKLKPKFINYFSNLLSALVRFSHIAPKGASKMLRATRAMQRNMRQRRDQSQRYSTSGLTRLMKQSSSINRETTRESSSNC